MITSLKDPPCKVRTFYCKYLWDGEAKLAKLLQSSKLVYYA